MLSYEPMLMKGGHHRLSPRLGHLSVLSYEPMLMKPARCRHKAAIWPFSALLRADVDEAASLPRRGARADLSVLSYEPMLMKAAAARARGAPVPLSVLSYEPMLMKRQYRKGWIYTDRFQCSPTSRC